MPAQFPKPPAAVMGQVEQRQRRDVDRHHRPERDRQGVCDRRPHDRDMADGGDDRSAADLSIHPGADASKELRHGLAVRRRACRILEPRRQPIGHMFLEIGDAPAGPGAEVEIREERLHVRGEREGARGFHRGACRAREDKVRAPLRPTESCCLAATSVIEGFVARGEGAGAAGGRGGGADERQACRYGRSPQD